MSGQIGLQNMIPLCTFCCSRCFCRCFCAELQAVLSLKLPQWDSTGSDLISVIHASFNFWTRHVGLDRRFQTAVDVEERTVGGEHFKLGFRWAGAPSYTKITPRRDLDLSSPVRGSYRNAQHSFRQQLLRKTHASQLMSDIAMVTGRCHHRWPYTWRYALSLYRGLPWPLVVQTL